MATGKPLEIIVDEAIYDLPEIQALAIEGHTIKKLLTHGYDLILGPKVMNICASDIKESPKLLSISIEHGKKLKYGVGRKVKEAKASVDDTKEPAGAVPEIKTESAEGSKPAPRKRKPRAKKSTGGSVASEPGPAAPANTDPITTADTTGGGK